MPEPDVHPVQVDYAIDPTNMQQGITWYLEPVTKRLEENGRAYTDAHADIASAHQSEAPGWFGGEGNGRVRPATSSFLNAVEWQLRQLIQDQTELTASLLEYKAMLEGHIEWATGTDKAIADRFISIGNDLDNLGR